MCHIIVVNNSNSCYENSVTHLLSPMLSPKQLKEKYPLTAEDHLFVRAARERCRALLDGRDRRLAIICGPCSIHHIESALKYASFLKNLSAQVEEKFFLVMRTYIEKPRTSTGWKGFVYQPDPQKEYNLQKGIELSRFLLREIIRLELPIAIELLDPHIFPYFDDLISWGFIGSRTSSSQIHRQMASLCDFPVGIKNATDGSIEPAIHSICVAKEPQSFFGVGQSGHIEVINSPGNPYAHLVLRGGDKGPNCHISAIQEAKKSLVKAHLPTPIIVDCSHGNSGKDYLRQPYNFRYLEQLAASHPELINGMMLESFIKEAAQPIEMTQLDPEQSITDSCIDWETTQRLLTQSSLLNRTRAFASTT